MIECIDSEFFTSDKQTKFFNINTVERFEIYRVFEDKAEIFCFDSDTTKHYLSSCSTHEAAVKELTDFLKNRPKHENSRISF